MMSLRRTLKLLALSFLATVFLLVGASTSTSAWDGGLDEIPDRSINSINWNNIYIEISKPGGTGNTLYAPEVYAKLSYDQQGTTGDPTGRHRLRIYDFCMGSGSQIDYGIGNGYASGDCFNSGANVTNATVCVMDAQENITGNCQVLNSCPFGCFAPNEWSSYIDINLGGGIRSNLNGKYNYSIRFNFANYAAVPAGNLNAFRVEASWGRAGFMATGQHPVAVQNRNKSQNFPNTPHEDHMTFKLKVRCDFSAPSFNLRWFDADANTFDPNIEWVLTNETTNQQISARNIAASRGQTLAQFMGGDGESRTENIPRTPGFTFRPGDILRWDWLWVQANNGVTLYMPFDDAKTDHLPCPPLGNVDSADCNFIRGWAFDPNNLGASLTFHVYFNGPAGVGQGFAFGPGQYNVASRPDVGAAYPGVGNNRGFEIPIPAQFKNGSTHSAYVYVLGVNANGSLNGNNPMIGMRTFGPCPPTLSCGTATLTPSAPDVNEAFNLIVRGSPAQSGATGFVAIRVGDDGAAAVAPGTNVPNGVTAGAYNASGQRSFSNISISQAGTYYIRWTYSVSGGSVVCSQPVTITAKPYLKVFGNDVQAGSDFMNSSTSECNASQATNNRAAILTFARNNGPQSTGAGTQLANFALGTIWGNNSAATRNATTSTAPRPPTGLTFGNYHNAPTYGGQSGQYRCIPNYYDQIGSRISTSPSTSTAAVTGSGALANAHRRPSSGIINFSRTNLTSKTAFVVDGDVYITQNGVTYAGYTNVADMPSLYLIVRGDIKIDYRVTQLDGVYIAQPKVDGSGNPTSQGGTIYTCVQSATAFVPSTALARTAPNTSTCLNPLTINGAFIARDVKFLRTNGTLNNSAQNETWTSNNIAEVFKSGPELYLSAPDVLRRGSTNSRTYDSITSLPPVL